MLLRRRLAVQERRHSAPDLQGDDLGELSDIIKFILQHDDVSAITGNGTGEYSRLQRVDTSSNSAFVFRDRITGFFVKGTPKDSASAEFETMNYLSDALTHQEIGVRAVRHAYLIVPKSDRLPAMNIVEPASGKMLNDIYGKVWLLGTHADPKYQESMDDVRQRLDNVLTREVRQILANDLHGDNVFRNNAGVYTIIDQPHPDYPKDAADWLAVQTLKRSA